MAKKTTIYLSDPLLKAVGPHGEDGTPSLSGRLATLGERYVEVLRKSRPEFSKAEWCVILDANNGGFEGIAPANFGAILFANISGAAEQGIGPKWGLTDSHVRDLAIALRKLPHAAQLSIVEAVEQFWLLPDLPTDEGMTAAGIVPQS